MTNTEAAALLAWENALFGNDDGLLRDWYTRVAVVHPIEIVMRHLRDRVDGVATAMAAEARISPCRCVTCATCRRAAAAAVRS